MPPIDHMDWIGLGHRVDGLDWTGFRKLDPCPTLRCINSTVGLLFMWQSVVVSDHNSSALLPSSPSTTDSSTCWHFGNKVTARLVQAFIISRLDYCNSVLAALLEPTIRCPEFSSTTYLRSQNLRPHHAKSYPAALAAHSLADTVQTVTDAFRTQRQITCVSGRHSRTDFH